MTRQQVASVRGNRVDRLRGGAIRQARRIRSWADAPGVGFWSALAALLALFLCSTVFHFDGPKVDESEVVLNALAIASGDWNPVWSPGYGHLAMYLPAAVIALVAFLMQLSGAAASYSDGLYLLFADDAAYRITRYLYTLADVGTALLLARLIARASGQRWMALAFGLYFLASPDTWMYASFIRTDTLVSFFIAAGLVVMAGRRRWSTPYLLGISLGAAIACKYSAAVNLPLVGFLLLPHPDDADGFVAGFRRRLGMAVTAGVVALVATLVFQPLYDYSDIVSSIGSNLAGSHFTEEQAPLAQRMSRLWQLVHTVEPAALALAMLAPACLLRWRLGLPLLAAVFLGIAPFAVSNFPREYWLLPFADLLRAAGWLGAACLVAWAGTRFGNVARRALVALSLLVAVAAAWTRLPELAATHAVNRGEGLSNVEAARRWLYVHAANRFPVAYGYEKNYVLPRAYSFASYEDAASFSRVFIFYREEFQSLHEFFRRRLYGEEFAEFSSITAIPQLRISVAGAAAVQAAGQLPKVCAGSRCYPPKQVQCSPRAAAQLEACVAYSWDMDRPSLRHTLSIMAVELPPAIGEFTACWYDCDTVGAEALLGEPHQGRIPMTRIGEHLFASGRVLRLTEIRQLQSPERTYVVTTPGAYLSWLPPDRIDDPRGASAAFAELIDARLIRYFDGGSGPAIEIYQKEGRPSR